MDRQLLASYMILGLALLALGRRVISLVARRGHGLAPHCAKCAAGKSEPRRRA